MEYNTTLVKIQTSIADAGKENKVVVNSLNQYDSVKLFELHCTSLNGDIPEYPDWRDQLISAIDNKNIDSTTKMVYLKSLMEPGTLAEQALADFTRNGACYEAALKVLEHYFGIGEYSSEL
ncbi:unnamed protein product [Lepeophtheirus salmonis]|uniref:(salmon louse) hypothetical protein n=1 Tax=Lepeophtheirus salmonis TaxID=72036 RepID=A0A7R8H7C5_LEPSM|nr:unnamed protein product [Lepeophtheirus salmonis]CAF2899307.1 unnamed protein product [Lepeophtheirus salmonis]